jgi:beta-barrel assembly-enhancing protease
MGYKIRIYMLLAATIPSGLAGMQARATDYDQLPDLGSSSATIISAREEQMVGDDFIRRSRQQLDFVNDPELLIYINKVGNRIAEASNHPEQSFNFYLIDDASLNAFAVPGGHIAVHTGLLLEAENEDQLASVLAHEVAHVTQHHIARGIEKSKGNVLTTLATVLAAAALGGQAAQAALIYANASAIEKRLSYSREFEREADSIGIRSLYAAGYSPDEMPGFFRTLQRWGRIKESGAPEFLRSHPLTVSRISESAARTENYPDVPLADQTDFNYARAKIRAMYAKNIPSELALIESEIAETENAAPADLRFAYSLILMRANKYDQARSEIAELIYQYPDHVGYKLAQSDIELEAQNYDLGIAQLSKVRETLSEDWSHYEKTVDMYYANALVLTERFVEAIPVLRKSIRSTPGEPLFHIMLARAYGESGETFKAYQSRGEYHYLSGNLGFAQAQFKEAASLATSYYDKASVQARLEDIRRQFAILGVK